jgi:hypothetical protein
MDLSALSLEVSSEAGDARPNSMVAAKQLTNKTILTTKVMDVIPWAGSDSVVIV